MPAFEDDDKTVESKVSLKAPKTKSIFDGAPKKPSREEFEKKASEANDRLNSYPERSAELVPLFIKLVNNKTLLQNKTIVDTDIERDIITKLTELALEINDDQLERNGAGAIGLNVLLMKCMLIQRDKINTLEYAVEQLKIEINTLKTPKPLDTK